MRLALASTCYRQPAAFLSLCQKILAVRSVRTGECRHIPRSLIMKSKPLSLFSKDSCLESNIQRERDHLLWAFQLPVRLTETTAHKNRTDLSLFVQKALLQRILASNNFCANGKVSVSCGSALTLGSPFRDACKGWPCLISVMRIVPSAGPVCNHCLITVGAQPSTRCATGLQSAFQSVFPETGCAASRMLTPLII